MCADQHAGVGHSHIELFGCGQGGGIVHGGSSPVAAPLRGPDYGISWPGALQRARLVDQRFLKRTGRLL
jgi:hypothetical protein